MKIEIMEREGWQMSCPSCGEKIRYTMINNQQRPVPFFYSEDSNDVLLRKSDEIRLDSALGKSNSNSASIEVLGELWKSILNQAPLTRTGAKFGLWTNVKCPYCLNEIPYNGGIRNLEQRIYEPKIVLIDGALLIGDSLEESWEVRVNLMSQE